MSVGGPAPPRRHLPTAPGVPGGPTAPGRKQEIPPRWEPGPEVPPLDGCGAPRTPRVTPSPGDVVRRQRKHLRGSGRRRQGCLGFASGQSRPFLEKAPCQNSDKGHWTIPVLWSM